MNQQTIETTLIRGGFLYTADKNNNVIPNSWILIEGNSIKEIGISGKREPDAQKFIDASGKLILPFSMHKLVSPQLDMLLPESSSGEFWLWCILACLKTADGFHSLAIVCALNPTISSSNFIMTLKTHFER